MASVLIPPYVLLTLYYFAWILANLSQIFGGIETVFLIFTILSIFYIPLEGYFLVLKIRRYIALHDADPTLRKRPPDISLHYNAIITAGVLVSSLIMSFWLLLAHNPNIWIGRLWIILLLKSLEILLRWVYELTARNFSGFIPLLTPWLRWTRHGSIGTSKNLDLVTCYRILYRASWFTRRFESIDKHALSDSDGFTERMWTEIEHENRLDVEFYEDPHETRREMEERQRRNRGRIVVAWQWGIQVGKETPWAVVTGVEWVFKPIYFVASGILVGMDNIARESVRQGNLIGRGRGEYADDGENLLAIDVDAEGD